MNKKTNKNTNAPKVPIERLNEDARIFEERVLSKLHNSNEQEDKEQHLAQQADSFESEEESADFATRTSAETINQQSDKWEPKVSAYAVINYVYQGYVMMEMKERGTPMSYKDMDNYREIGEKMGITYDAVLEELRKDLEEAEMLNTLLKRVNEGKE